MSYYKSQFLDWLSISWYLISAPFIKLYSLFIDYVAPKWFVYLLFSYKLKHMKEVGKQQNLIDWAEIIYKKNKITRKQADKLIELVKKVPEKKVMEAFIPDKEDMFDREEN